MLCLSRMLCALHCCRFDEEGMTALLLAPGALGVPGVSGTRNLRDNISDLKAQARWVFIWWQLF